MDHKNDQEGAQRRESRLKREQNANRFTPFSPPSSTGQHGTVTTTSAFNTDNFSIDFNPDKTGVIRSRTPDIRAFNAKVSAAATRRDSRPVPPPVNTSFIGRAFPEWDQPADAAKTNALDGPSHMNISALERFSSIHVPKKRTYQDRPSHPETSSKPSATQAPPLNTSSIGRTFPEWNQPLDASNINALDGPSKSDSAYERFSSIHLSNKRSYEDRPSHPELIPRPSAPEPLDWPTLEEAHAVAIATASHGKENIPPPAEESVSVEHVLGKERLLSRAEMQPRVDTISNCSDGTINETATSTLIHHHSKASRQRRPSDRPLSPLFSPPVAQPAVTNYNAARAAFTDLGTDHKATRARVLENLQRCKAAAAAQEAKAAAYEAQLTAVSIKESPVKATSSKQSPAETTTSRATKTFILPTFRHLADLTSGTLRFSTMRDGVPVFVKHGKARTKIGPSINEHDTVAGIDLPEEDKDIFVSMDKIREEVRQLQDHDEVVQREAEELRHEVERLHNQLKQLKQRKASVSDSAFGSGSESEFSFNRALEHQRRLYDEKIMQLQSRLDQASRKVGVHDIHSAALTAERDEALQRASVAKAEAANLKAELEETQKNLSATSCYRQEIEKLQKQVKTLRRTIDELRDEYQDLSKEHRSVKADHAQLQHDYDDSREQLRAAREELQELRYDYESVQDEIKVLAVDHASLEQNNQAYFDENKSLRSKAEASNARIADLEKSLAVRDQLIDQMKANMTTQTVPVDHYAALEDQVRKLSQRQVSLQEEMDAEIENVVRSSAGKVRALQEEMDNIIQFKNNKIEELGNIVQAKDSKIDELNCLVQARDQVMKEMDKDLHLKDHEIGSLRGELDGVVRIKDDKIDFLRKLDDEAHAQTKRYEAIVSETNETATGLLTTLHERDDFLRAKEHKIDTLVAEQQELERVLQTKDQRIRCLLSDQKEMDSHFKAKDERIRNLMTEISNLQERISSTHMLRKHNVELQETLKEALSRAAEPYEKAERARLKAKGDTTQNAAWTDDDIDWTHESIAGPLTAPVTNHKRHKSDSVATQKSKLPISILKKTTQFTRDDTMTGNVSVRSGPSARFDDTVQSGMSTNSVERNMTSAYILPDITLGKEDKSKETQSNEKKPENTQATPADQQHIEPALDKTAQPANEAMCIHKVANCTVCSRISSKGKAPAWTLPKNSPTKSTSTGSSHHTRIHKPQPVTDRQPSQDIIEPTLRPSMPPSRALAIVIEELERECMQYEDKIQEATQDYFKLDKSKGKSVRKVALTKLTNLQRIHDMKSGQIYKLHDVLEGQKEAGQEMTQDEIDATIASICVPTGDEFRISC